MDELSQKVRLHAERVAESGAAGLAGLYDLTCQRLVRFAVTISRNQHDAEDAVQAALLRVASEPGLLHRAEQPWPYLLRMVRNETLLVLRRKQRILRLPNLRDLVTRRNVDEVELQETHQAVWQALRRLPVEQSQVVVLKIWEEFTFAEIGEVLEISPSTAASRYRYAVEKLARCLRKQDGEVIHE